MGIEQRMLKTKDMLPQNCIRPVPCRLLLFINIIAAIISTIINIKSRIPKFQNIITEGVFSINKTSLIDNLSKLKLAF